MSEPKQYWIGEEDGYLWVSELAWGNLIPVIEKQAYDALKAENEKLKEVIEGQQMSNEHKNGDPLKEGGGEHERMTTHRNNPFLKVIRATLNEGEQMSDTRSSELFSYNVDDEAGMHFITQVYFKNLEDNKHRTEKLTVSITKQHPTQDTLTMMAKVNAIIAGRPEGADADQ